MEKKKNIAAKILMRLMGVLLALGMVFGTFNARETGASAAENKSKTKQESSKPTKKQIRSIVKKICKANKLEKIIKKYGNVLVYDNAWVAYADKECSYTMTEKYEYAAYADKDTYCELIWGEKDPGLYYHLMLDKDVDFYDATFARGYIEWNFTYESFSENEVISLREENGRIIITQKLSEKNVEYVKGAWELETESEEMYDVLVVDAETYEIEGYYTYDSFDAEDPILYAVFYYGEYKDDTKFEECALLRAMAKRTEHGTTTVTVVVDPGTENEYTKKTIVPAGAMLNFLSDNVEKVTYKNAKCTKKAKDWDTKSDITLYVKSKSAEADTE